MNKNYTLFHLKEAHEEIESMINDIKGNDDYDFGEFMVSMMHLYNHVNIAWNARDASEERAKECSEEDFANWRQFPKDIDMSA